MDSEYEKIVGYNIRKIRKSMHITQDELAAKLQVRGCDITRSALAKIEVGQRHIYIDEIKALKEIFGVTFEQLFV